MKCPFCGGDDDRVIDSRTNSEGDAIRRRRECQLCERRYTTYERLEEVPRLVLKKDQRREPFNRQKVLQGLLKACEKRPVPYSRLEEVVDLVERRIQEEFEHEVDSPRIGEMLAAELQRIDQVAFVRFASVYREFADVTEFLQELMPLIGPEKIEALGFDVTAGSGAEPGERPVLAEADDESGGEEPESDDSR